ncbi:cytochrome P450 [Marinobacter sp. VGCF2001]|uniref:cytochrome P450 n=1 Tax=Marinobacter sp. VGCF2001 TaxID=3417189 RepID=UPI003CF2EA54
MTAPHRDDWNPRAASVQDNQIQAYDTMRRECPVAWSEYQQWTLFRYADVMRVLEDPESFSNAVSAHLSVPNGMDPPEHTRYRDVIEPYFAPEPMARFEPVCRDVARRLVQSIQKNQPLDVVNTLSRPFALQIQCAFMGWPESLHQPLADWVLKNHRATLAGDRAAMAEVAEEFDGYIRGLLDARRQPDGTASNDVTTQLMREQINGQPMDDEELVSLLRNWTVGELATISASVSILIHYLAQHPGQLDALKAAPDTLSSAIDEILRINAPLISNRRITTREVEIGGRTIPAGEKITLLWASANRDEDIFGDPDQYCPHDNAPKNLLYGAGIHVCPGAPLARLELNVFMEELLKQIDTVEPVASEQPELALFPAGGFNSLTLVFR